MQIYDQAAPILQNSKLLNSMLICYQAATQLQNSNLFPLANLWLNLRGLLPNSYTIYSVIWQYSYLITEKDDTELTTIVRKVKT